MSKTIYVKIADKAISKKTTGRCGNQIAWVIKMNQFALFGTYESSDIYEELAKMRDAIHALNEELDGKDRDVSNPKAEKLIDEFLGSVDIVDEITGFVHEISIVGIFRLETCNNITVECKECKKILFEGTKKQARRLVIYCTDCSQ